MKKFLSLVIMAVALLFATPVKAAVSDCTAGCFVYLQDSGAHFVHNNGTVAGSIPSLGTGGGEISASEGYVIVTRGGSNNVWIVNVATETSCMQDIGAMQTGMSVDEFKQKLIKAGE